MGAGFAELLSLDTGSQMTGADLGDLLKVESSRIELITERIRNGSSDRALPLICRSSQGREIEVRVSGVYLPIEHAVEVVLICHPDSFERHADHQETMDDLERFRKGMMRREKRILDLKAEVNKLLTDAEEAPRYEIDANTSDHKVRMMSTRREEAAD